jgi:hypothetical protein
MRHFPPIANWVRVSLILMFAIVYCAMLLGVMAAAALMPDLKTEVLASIGLIVGTALSPFLRDLVGLPQRRSFEKCVKAIAKYFRTA